MSFCKKSESEGLRMISQEMPIGNYTFSIKCLDDYPVWTDKTKTIYGSDWAKAIVEWNGAKVELLGISSPENLTNKRARFIIDHQQMHKAGYPSQEALMIYDNKTK